MDASPQTKLADSGAGSDRNMPDRGRLRDVEAVGTGVSITRLSLTDFRSYAAFSVTLDGRPVTISGQNGAGKTNILEALSLFSPGRGLRGAKMSELARLEGPGTFAVSARIFDGEDARALGVGTLPEAPDRRTCRLDGRPLSGPGAFSALLRFVWLTPAHDRLFVEGASERRRFFDRMIAAYDPGFTSLSSAYEQAMRQRQKLLDDGSRDGAWLSSLEEQMATNGVAIAAARREMAERLSVYGIGDEQPVFPAADIALEGELETSLSQETLTDAEDRFIERLSYQRGRDREAGRALVGPHRTDWLVGHRPKGRPARLCSTGEQKALLIGLVLAHARGLACMENERRAPLVLLLDEIAAHLDEDRRSALFDILAGLGFPVFMTGTDQSLFTGWGDRAQHLALMDGAVTELTMS